jgi:hypothetical protein
VASNGKSDSLYFLVEISLANSSNSRSPRYSLNPCEGVNILFCSVVAINFLLSIYPREFLVKLYAGLINLAKYICFSFLPEVVLPVEGSIAVEL